MNWSDETVKRIAELDAKRRYALQEAFETRGYDCAALTNEAAGMAEAALFAEAPRMVTLIAQQAAIIEQQRELEATIRLHNQGLADAIKEQNWKHERMIAKIEAAGFSIPDEWWEYEPKAYQQQREALMLARKALNRESDELAKMVDAGHWFDCQEGLSPEQGIKMSEYEQRLGEASAALTAIDNVMKGEANA